MMTIGWRVLVVWSLFKTDLGPPCGSWDCWHPERDHGADGCVHCPLCPAFRADEEPEDA